MSVFDVNLFTADWYKWDNIVFAESVAEPGEIFLTTTSAERILGYKEGAFYDVVTSAQFREFFSFDVDNWITDETYSLDGVNFVNLISLHDFLLIVNFEVSIGVNYELLDLLLYGFADSIRSSFLEQSGVAHSPFARSVWMLKSISMLASEDGPTTDDTGRYTSKAVLHDGLTPTPNKSVVSSLNQLLYGDTVEPPAPTKLESGKQSTNSPTPSGGILHGDEGNVDGSFKDVLDEDYGWLGDK